MKLFQRLLLLLTLSSFIPVLAGEVSEYSVKAAYLFNFAKFVQWPAKAFKNEKSHLVIGVLGDDPFGEELDQVVEGKTINGHSIETRRFDNFDPKLAPDLSQCHILFIAYSEKGRLKNILESLKNSRILTVSEIENFPILGGGILFDQVGKRVKLIINLDAAHKAGLVISAKLLQVSKVYKSGKL
jgi:hypothetical protein